MARAWRETYGLPTILTNCSNNYGPYHFPEKLIPLAILNAVEGKRLPVYGRGENIRDWLYVEDHATALLVVAKRGVVGQSYNIGGRSERRNIDVVHAICDILDEIQPRAANSYREQIAFVADRPGHDLRYAIDCSKIERELGWRASESFETGLRKTVRWYLDNPDWWGAIRSAPTAASDWAWAASASASLRLWRFGRLLVQDAPLAGVKIVTPKKHGDHRGFFSEVYNEATWRAAGLDIRFVQDNHSLSAAAGTVRGLHFQIAPHGQAKLVRVVRRRIRRRGRSAP